MSFLNRSSRGLPLGEVLPTLESLPPIEEVTDDRRVLVTSGSSVVGYRVAMSLLQAGHPSVRVGIYHGSEDRADERCGPQCVEKLKAKGAEVVSLDWTDEEDFDAALKDVQTVFCTIPNVEGWQDVFPKFARKCMYKNVEHFIKISFLRPNPTNGVKKAFTDMALKYRDRVPFCSFHGTSDEYLMALARQDDNPMSYTILATSHLMTTPLFWQAKLIEKENTFVSASYGMGVNYISPNDVADAAVVAILQPKKHANRIYNLTGPGCTTDAQIVKLLSAHLQRPIQHKSLGYHEYVSFLTRKCGLPAWHAKDSSAMERMKAKGLDELPSSYTNDLEKLTGKKPEPFAEFLKNGADNPVLVGMQFR